MQRIKGSYAGMAHFANTGPDGETCRFCVHFKDDGYYAERSHHQGALKPGKCSKYKALMGKWGGSIPHTASACRHFEKNETPPVLRSQDK